MGALFEYARALFISAHFCAPTFTRAIDLLLDFSIDYRLTRAAAAEAAAPIDYPLLLRDD